MRFLVKITMNREAAVHRGDAQIRQAFSELKKFYETQQQAGKLEAVYALTGQDSGYTVWNVQSPEELDEFLTQHPLVGVTDREISVIASAATGGTHQAAAGQHTAIAGFEEELDRATKTSPKHG